MVSDLRNPKNQLFYDENSTSSSLFCNELEQFINDKGETASTEDWHSFLANESIEIDVRNDVSLGAILWRLPRQSHSFCLRLDALVGENKQRKRPLMLNEPLAAETCGNKEYLMELQQLCPKMKMIHDENELKEFFRDNNNTGIVLKPVASSGGVGMIKIDSDQHVWLTATSSSYNSIDEWIAAERPNLVYLGMKYLKNVGQGDKRIIVVDGQVIGASLRMPKAESWICNASQGATSHYSQVTTEEENIIKVVAENLKQKGILICGLDTLVDDDGKRILSEINCLSVGGMLPLQAVSGLPILTLTSKAIWKCIQDRERMNAAVASN